MQTMKGPDLHGESSDTGHAGRVSLILPAYVCNL